MTALGIIQWTLCVLHLAAAALSLPVQYRIYRHVRRQHPRAFRRLGISSPAFLWREDRDAESMAFDELCASGNPETLQDPRLQALRRRGNVLAWMCGASLALLLITFVVFRADPGNVGDFMLDLSRY
jgi:hypothetical protein